jgi:phosphatidylglycerol:prolipoprotein diacylglycerol transferase
VALVILAGTVVVLYEGKRVGFRTTDLIDALIWTAIGGIIGSRLEYVLLNMQYFREQPYAAFRAWEGGFAYHGGLICGLAGLILFAYARRLKLWELADVMALGLALSTAIGWIACLFAGCAYGRMGFGPLYFVWYDIFGMDASRFAVQPVGALLNLLLFLSLWFARRRLPVPGSVFVLLMMGSGLVHFVLGFGRGDETLRVFTWRVDQWLAVGQVVFAAAIAILRGRTLPEIA